MLFSLVLFLSLCISCISAGSTQAVYQHDLESKSRIYGSAARVGEAQYFPGQLQKRADAFTTLGIQYGATKEEIDAAVKRYKIKYHPDRVRRKENESEEDWEARKKENSDLCAKADGLGDRAKKASKKRPSQNEMHQEGHEPQSHHPQQEPRPQPRPPPQRQSTFNDGPSASQRQSSRSGHRPMDNEQSARPPRGRTRDRETKYYTDQYGRTWRDASPGSGTHYVDAYGMAHELPSTSGHFSRQRPGPAGRGEHRRTGRGARQNLDSQIPAAGPSRPSRTSKQGKPKQLTAWQRRLANMVLW